MWWHVWAQSEDVSPSPSCLLQPEQLQCLCTLMIPWQVASGSPTRLVLLMDMIWSPMLSLPERAAGPPFIMLAKITVGRMEPQPDSTITTPRISPLLFSSCSCGAGGGGGEENLYLKQDASFLIPYLTFSMDQSRNLLFHDPDIFINMVTLQ